VTLPVHYQAEKAKAGAPKMEWPLCGAKPLSYDSTQVWIFVTCPDCLKQRPSLLRRLQWWRNIAP
jgi:hypothetical protein